MNSSHHTCYEYLPQPVYCWPFNFGWSFPLTYLHLSLWSHHYLSSLFSSMKLIYKAHIRVRHWARFPTYVLI